MSFTEAGMKKAVLKFNKYGRGVVTTYSSPSLSPTSTKQANEHTYHDLINPKLFDLSNLKSILRDLSKKMALHVQDKEIFEKTPIYFKHETSIGDIIRFSVKECYYLVRAAYLEQRNNKAIINAKKRRIEIVNKLESMKSKSQIKKDLYQELEELDRLLD